MHQNSYIDYVQLISLKIILKGKMFMKNLLASLAIGFLMFGMIGMVHANLITNGSFETVPSTATGQGIMPSDWQATNVTPDTYSNDGSYGLLPSAGGNFTGVVAKEGKRWVAGWSSAGQERFGQDLSSNLVSGLEYDFSGWLHQAVRSDLNYSGGFEIYLTDTPGTLTTQIGFLGPTTSVAAGWQQYSFSFTATIAMESLGFIEFAPIVTASGSAYPGLDLVSLEGPGQSSPVPEPATMLLFGLGLLGLAGVNRRKK
ncbi:MAG: PEP-CTERM sorting domain-containing protein [Desulfobacteraceae bacterium]|nr:PEP-CTERM sorting domain-containing protein [Desulfobacteraceae bacterium]